MANDWNSLIQEFKRANDLLLQAHLNVVEAYFNVNFDNPPPHTSNDPVLRRLTRQFAQLVVRQRMSNNDPVVAISLNDNDQQVADDNGHVEEVEENPGVANGLDDNVQHGADDNGHVERVEKNPVVAINDNAPEVAREHPLDKEKVVDINLARRLFQKFCDVMEAWSPNVKSSTSCLKELLDAVTPLHVSVDTNEPLEELIRPLMIEPELQEKMHKVVADLNSLRLFILDGLNQKLTLVFAITGSVAAGVATKEADLDLVVKNFTIDKKRDNETWIDFFKRNKKKMIEKTKNLKKTMQRYRDAQNVQYHRGFAPIVHFNIGALHVDVNLASGGLQLNLDIAKFLQGKDKFRLFLLAIKAIFKRAFCVNTKNNLLSSSALVLMGVSYLHNIGGSPLSLNELLRGFGRYLLEFDYVKNGFTFSGVEPKESFVLHNTSGSSPIMVYDHHAYNNLARNCSKQGWEHVILLSNLLIKLPSRAFFN